MAFAVDPELTTSDITRFLSKVDHRGPDECWPWTGGFHLNGYGLLRHAGPRGHRKHVFAHRVAFFVAHGHWPSVLTRHTCDWPPCCNFGHLLDGNHELNARDASERGLLADPELTRHCGESNGRSKLTIDQVAEIRARYAKGGIRQADLAPEYGISQVMVSCIVRGANWTGGQ